MTVHRRCPMPCGLLETWGPPEAPRAKCKRCRKEVADLSEEVRVAPPPRDWAMPRAPARRRRVA